MKLINFSFGESLRKIIMILKKLFKTPLLKCWKLQVSIVFSHIM